MSKTEPDITGDVFDSSQLHEQPYVLRLYVAGITPRSTTAIKNVTNICRQHLQGRFDLQVIDVYQHPNMAVKEQIVAAPTLVKMLPLPLRRFIGDMASEEKLLAGLDLSAKTA